MVRKRETVAEREARVRVRERFDAEVKAVGEFFGYAEQIDQLQQRVAVLEAQQADTVVGLVGATDVARAAATIAWPVARVRDIMSRQRHDLPNDGREPDNDRP